MRLILAAGLAAAALLVAPSAPRAERSVDGDEELLPIHETPAERAWLLANPPPPAPASDPPPAAPVRNVAEFEPCTGALIRYPLGVPYPLIHELAEEVTVHVVVSAASHPAAVANFVAQGVDTSRVEWVVAPNNSIWTRDYGPWFVFDGNGDLVILDHHYNRPARPQDDLIPQVVGALWGIPVVTHDLWHTGGNYMTEGHGISCSSDLVWDENPGMTAAGIAEFMHDYYGLEAYHVLDDISIGGIHHIDTWGKLLDEETVLMKRVSPGHADYARIEANVAVVEGLTNAYGRPYTVVRVDCPPIPSGNVAAYTNSLILNGKVLVPLFNKPAEDAAALQVYRDAMPGYEVLGFQYSGWITDDALHCRVMGIADRAMLRVDHDPLQRIVAGRPTPVSVFADDRSEAGLDAAETRLRWRLAGDPGWQEVPLAPDAEPDWYVAEIPPQAAGAVVEYCVTARDLTGRVASRPRTAPAAAYRLTVEEATSVAAGGGPGASRLDLAFSPTPYDPASHGEGRLRFHLPRPGRARLTLYDARGRETARVADRVFAAGEHELRWNARDADGARLAAGIYLAVLESAGERAASRIVLLR